MLIVIVLYLVLLALSIKVAFKSVDKRFTVFYCSCYVLSLVLLVLHSIGTHIPGPADWIMKLAESLALIEP